MAGDPDINYLFNKPHIKSNYFSPNGRVILPRHLYESAKLKVNSVLNGVANIYDIHNFTDDELTELLKDKPVLAFKKDYDYLLFTNNLLQINSRESLMRLFRAYILYHNKKVPVSSNVVISYIIEKRLEGTYRIHTNRVSQLLRKSPWFDKADTVAHGIDDTRRAYWELTEEGIGGIYD